MANSKGAPRIAAIAGSMREGSFNKRLLRVAAEAAEALGAEVDWIELRELELPLYDGDLERDAGLPAGAMMLQERMRAAEGLLLACPEYNHSLPGTFKNAIDWASRGKGSPFPNKAAAMVGASTGAAGAMRALMQLRLILAGRGCWVVPAQVTVPNAASAFDDAGALKDEGTQKQVETTVKQLIQQIERMRAVPPG